MSTGNYSKMVDEMGYLVEGGSLTSLGGRALLELSLIISLSSVRRSCSFAWCRWLVVLPVLSPSACAWYLRESHFQILTLIFSGKPSPLFIGFSQEEIEEISGLKRTQGQGPKETVDMKRMDAEPPAAKRLIAVE